MASIRRIKFEYPDDTRPVWTPHKPEVSLIANSVSMMMPTMEPYFVRTIRSQLPNLDAELANATELFIAQEAAHYRQHRRFNQILTNSYPALVKVETLMAKVFDRIESRRSAAFSLALVTVFEAVAYSIARWVARRRLDFFGTADATTSSLFLWHLAEEVEHKSAAFEVNEAADNNGRFRLFGAVVTALSILCLFSLAGTCVMLTKEKRLLNPVAWLRMWSWLLSFSFGELLPNLTLFFLPKFHPNKLADPAWYSTWLAEVDSADGTIPIWRT